ATPSRLTSSRSASRRSPPVRASGGTVLAALSVSGPAARLTPQRLRLLAGVAVEQAHGLSAQLGYDVPLEDVLDDAARR
ncbi:MAG: hypothetical protein M3P39_02645, partial [Actinomycetota bacterium]|nr:hypothetical protein [Actinomycetota bacterium]